MEIEGPTDADEETNRHVAIVKENRENGGFCS
jgi:hypothetical protein